MPPPSPPTTPLLLLLLAITITTSRVVYPQGLWPMNSFGSFTSENEEILAYYDFNRDRFVDVLTRTSTVGYQLQLYLWNQANRTFVKSATVDMELFKPIQAIPTSITDPTKLNLLLTLQLPPQPQTTLLYTLTCPQPFTCQLQSTQLPPFTSLTYPTVLQLQGENVILYNDDGKLEVLKYVKGEGEGVGELKDWDFVGEYFLEASQEVRERVCAEYLEVFYLDYNGDCFQDIVIHCKPEAGMADLQFYRGNQKGQFKTEYRASVTSPMKLLNVAIADINFDGLVDIIQLISSPTGQLSFQIHYNTATKQKYQTCKTTIQSKTSNYFPFHFISSQSQLEQDGILQIQRYLLNFSNTQWTLQKMNYWDFYLRPGDINNDGYLDFVIDGPNKAELVINMQCLNQFCGTYNTKFMEQWPLGKIRTFEPRKIDGMANYNGKICKMSFFDLHEDGRLDLMTNLCPIDNQNKQNPGMILVVFNALSMDAFFLKITILENLANDKVVPATMDKKLNVYGAHADFYVTALTGERVPACGNQLSHPGRSLELPFIHSGLGRTNNYVEEISVTISGKEMVLMKTWTPIVPNSQLIIVPGPKWVLETYISPTAVMNILFWFIVAILILVAFWILKLTRKQKIEDKQNEDSFYTILR